MNGMEWNGMGVKYIKMHYSHSNQRFMNLKSITLIQSTKPMSLHLFFISAITLFLLIWALVSFKNTKKWQLLLPPSPKSLPIIGHLHLIDIVPFKSFHDLSLKFGPLIHLRLGSIPCIIASSPELAKELLTTHEKTFASRPITISIHTLGYKSSGFAFIPYGPYWRFMKKICMSELFGGQSLMKFKPIRQNEIRRLVQLLIEKSKNGGEIVNVTDEMMKVFNNVVSGMMLSIRYSENGEQAEAIRNLVTEVSEIFGQFNVSDFLWFLKNWDVQGYRKKSNDILRRYDVLVENIISKRERHRRRMKEEGKESEVKDFLDILLNVFEDEKSDVQITRDNVKAFVQDIMTAGTATSAVAAEWTLAELLNHPKVLEKAREEIDLVVGKNRLVEESDLPNLPYLQAIFKESLRLHPPAPMLARESNQDCKIGGYDIPAKTRLYVNVWSICRNPKYWEDPLEFKPERFMAKPPFEVSEEHQTVERDVKGQHFDLLPFGTGRRGCPGMWLALLELPTILASMIQCFDWKVIGEEGTIDMTERPGLSVPKAHPLMLVPVTRLNPFIT